MRSGLVFNVQRFSLQDGPGVRSTVFMKGCPLACAWCHNPESQSPEPQIVRMRHRCMVCGLCSDQELTELRAGTFHCNIDKMVDEVSYAWAPEDSFAVSDAIKEEYLASGCEAADVDHAVRRLMAECADLFEDANSAWSFLMEEPHEETEGEA